MDSDLEAFSHNPTDDSFAALAAQPTALPNIRTNGSSRTKLDYANLPALTKADVNKRIEEAMKDDQLLKHKESLEAVDGFFESWQGKDLSNTAFIVASDPLTFCEDRWCPVPSNSILSCRRGELPQLREIAKRPVPAKELVPDVIANDSIVVAVQ